MACSPIDFRAKLTYNCVEVIIWALLFFRSPAMKDETALDMESTATNATFLSAAQILVDCVINALKRTRRANGEPRRTLPSLRLLPLTEGSYL